MTTRTPTPATETKTQTTSAHASPIPAHIRDNFSGRDGLLQNDPERGIVRVHAQDLMFAVSVLVDRLAAYRDAGYQEREIDDALVQLPSDAWGLLRDHTHGLAALADALGTQQGRIDSDPSWQPDAAREGTTEDAAAR